MRVSPDDLPRSASGRVPQWVIDEVNGRPREPEGWRTYSLDTPPAPRSRLRWTGAAAVVAVAVLAGGWWLNGGTLGLPDLATAQLGPAAAVDPGGPTRPAPAPTAEVVALADAAHLSDEGRQLFYAARPQVLDAPTFVGRCGDVDATDGRGGGAVGCYQQGADMIVVYRPADPRLFPTVVESAAHELLHAAWVRLTPDDHARLVPLLEAEVAAIASTDPVHRQIAGSVGSHPQNRSTELFAYLGTQLWRDGGLAPELEAAYGRFIADRAALVAVHTGLEALLDGMNAEVAAASQAASARDLATSTDRLRYEADLASFSHYHEAYHAKVEELTATPAEHRQGLRLSWVWWDGTSLPMAAADETLARAAALLSRDQAALAAQEAAITAAEQASTAERARIDALVVDLANLHDQMVPGPVTS